MNILKNKFTLLLAALMLIGCYSCKTPSPASDATEESVAYEVYPLPQNTTYLGSQFTITDEVNVVIEPTIDEATRDFLEEILESKSLETTITQDVVSGKTNVIIGAKKGQGYVEQYFNENIDYPSSTFDKIDAYVLAINKKLGEHGTIAILGKGTDAAYYGLATLKMIFDQLEGQTIRSVKYADYADTRYRGFIEGFYGIPWSYDDRKSLMRFGGRFKMNRYIYAPKDDPYHSASWREPYPQEELEKLAELVDVAHATKVHFVWAIHPGFNMIDWNNYEEELDVLINKLEQLYSIGVRQFGVFMDDISLEKALKNREKHVKLITDVAQWAQAKGDVGSLIYTPPYYNQAWAEGKGEAYLKALRNVPESVEIMWTGRSVVAGVNPEDMQWVKERIQQKPFVWLNWPVNDYADSRLMLGKAEVLQSGTHNIAGIVSNPMAQAELSKVALFAIADYTWNVDEFNAQESWLNSFKYVAPHVAGALKTIAHHLSDPSPNSHGLVLGESENIKKELQQFLDRYKNSQPVEEVGPQLVSEFEHILQAIHTFRTEAQNEDMLGEIDPWLHALKQVVKADKYAAKAVLAMQAGKAEKAESALEKAAEAMEKSDNFTRTLIDGSEVTVEAGAKRLVPFAKKLIDSLEGQL